MKRRTEPVPVVVPWRTLLAEHAHCFGLTDAALGIALALSCVTRGGVDWRSGLWESTDTEMGTALGRKRHIVRAHRESLVVSGWWVRTSKGGKRGESFVSSAFGLAVPIACPKCGPLEVPDGLSAQLTRTSPSESDAQLGAVPNESPNESPSESETHEVLQCSGLQRNTSPSSSETQSDARANLPTETSALVETATRGEEGERIFRDGRQGVEVTGEVEEMAGLTTMDILAMAGVPAVELRRFIESTGGGVDIPGAVLLSRVERDGGPDLVVAELAQWWEAEQSKRERQAEMEAERLARQQEWREGAQERARQQEEDRQRREEEQWQELERRSQEARWVCPRCEGPTENEHWFCNGCLSENQAEPGVVQVSEFAATVDQFDSGVRAQEEAW